MKIVAWIIVIWVAISLIYGGVKEGADWIAPLKTEYKIQLRERPVVTIAITVVVLFVLFKILF